MKELASWDRYRLIERLGAGAMGEVYKAHDPRLDRHVALKFLLSASEETARPLLREAQAQARVDHEHVCKVYEVGEAPGGRPYIAMQLVKGSTLEAAARGMSIDQRVLVVAQVAEGLHAAHRIGLVHRDVKPANILVEQTEGGGYKPYVTDFGVAREIAAGSNHTTVDTAGTPFYMAPEQVRGEVKRLDRRTDVWGLGAMLYELLTGRPPFMGATPFYIFRRITNEEPPTLRRIDRTLPLDLQTIVLRCLEKEPQRRYESARALAEDLRRYLDGEPILARPAGRLYRLGKRARKHGALLAVAAAALIVSVVLGGLWLRTSRRATEQARLAQRFGQEVEKMDAALRLAVLLPLHDLRDEKAAVRERMRSLTEQMRRAGDAAQGPGHYALGRGHLALYEHALARTELEAAWQSGYRTPEVSYALGLALGELYREAREQLGQLPRELRPERERELSQKLREPALRHLQSAGGRDPGSDAPAAYGRALIALYEGRGDAALVDAEQALAGRPSFTEAWRLIGELRASASEERMWRGEIDGALAGLDRADEALRRAAEIGRSDPLSHDGLCRAALLRMQAEALRGTAPESSLGRARTSCDDAIQIDPERAAPFRFKTEALWRWADYQARSGQDPMPTLAEAEELGREALRRTDKSSLAHFQLASVLRQRGTYQLLHGGDPTAALTAAIALYLRAAELDPGSFQTFLDLGSAHDRLARHEGASGRDPRPTFELAVAAFEKARGLRPDSMATHSSLGNALRWYGEHLANQGADPRPFLDRAIAAQRTASSLGSAVAPLQNNFGAALRQRAITEAQRGGDPQPFYTEARAVLNKALELNPSYALAYSNLVGVYVEEADHLESRGRDGGALLALGEEALAMGLKLSPDAADLHSIRGELHRVRARRLLRLGQDPEAAFTAAQAAMDQAIRLNPKDPVQRIMRARIELFFADFATKSRPARALPLIESSNKLAEQALEQLPGQPDALAITGALRVLRGRVTTGAPERATLLLQAREQLAAALKKDPTLAAEYQRYLDEAQRPSAP